MCLAQGHNAVTPVRLEPTALRSRVKHSTTEPLRSLKEGVLGGPMQMNMLVDSDVVIIV